MTPAETLTTWRDELATEVAQLEADLSNALQERRDAEAEHSRVTVVCDQLFDTVKRSLRPREEVAPELHGRLEEERRGTLRAASNRRTAATNKFNGLQSTLASRRLAIAQIERALGDPQANVHQTAIRELAQRRKKKAAPVEFDTIREIA